MASTVKYDEYLNESLKDPEEAVGYLNAALDDGEINLFLAALCNVVQAHGGIFKLAESTHNSRNSLYKTLSEKGNPFLGNTNEILKALGFSLSVNVSQ